jgi:citrate synthase
MSADTLTITDNRTGKQYEVPIENGTIKAMELRKIKAADDDFGLMTYDPAFMKPLPARAALRLSMATRGFWSIAGTPLPSWRKRALISRSRICCCTVSYRMRRN